MIPKWNVRSFGAFDNLNGKLFSMRLFLLVGLLHRNDLSRALRSSDKDFLAPPHRTKHRTWGNRAFSVPAPSLPEHIIDFTDLIIFKTLTKTHFFNIAFNV